MDYLRIYNELIEHRKMMPKLEEMYYERHHIVPACLGGGDNEENLIYLTAEDHYIAHLLLARIHGGLLWWAASAMLMAAVDGRKVNNRHMFGVIKRESNKLRFKTADEGKIYEFVRVSDGKVINATRREMLNTYGLSIQSSKDLVTGRRKSSAGFHLRGVNPVTPRGDTNLHEIFCSEQGMTESLTRKQLKEKYGLSKQELTKLLVKGHTVKGLFLVGKLVDSSHKIRDKSKYTVFEIKTGNTLLLTRSEIEKMYGLSSAAICNLLSGRNKQLRGIKIIPENVIKEETPEEVS